MLCKLKPSEGIVIRVCAEQLASEKHIESQVKSIIQESWRRQIMIPPDPNPPLWEESNHLRFQKPLDLGLSIGTRGGETLQVLTVDTHRLGSSQESQAYFLLADSYSLCQYSLTC